MIPDEETLRQRISASVCERKPNTALSTGALPFATLSASFIAFILNRRMTTSKELHFCLSGEQLRPCITSVSKRVPSSSGEGQLSISLGDGKGHGARKREQESRHCPTAPLKCNRDAVISLIPDACSAKAIWTSRRNWVGGVSA